MKIVSVVGARPQFIKCAAVSQAIARYNNSYHLSPISIHHLIVHTGQHYDDGMSAIFFRELEIPEPDVNLGVGSGSHGWQTGQMLMTIEEVLLAEKPDWVLVYGDTNSTLAGALGASKINYGKELAVSSKVDAVSLEQLSFSNLTNSRNSINTINARGYRPLIAHVEAGLRSFNREMPEEHNRVLTDHCSDLLFCPTRTAVDNLAREGITQGVHRVGDTMYDAVLQFSEIARQRSTILQDLGLKPKGYLLATVHRPGNTDIPENLRNILAAFAEISEPVVFPVHPRTRRRMAEFGLSNASSAIPAPLNQEAIQPGRNPKFMDPVGYLDMLALEQNARLILTDSGGIQKEAYWLAVPCITLRDETEWVETVEAGWNVLTGANREKILKAVNFFKKPTEHSPLYGDGQSAEQCVQLLLMAYLRNKFIV